MKKKFWIVFFSLAFLVALFSEYYFLFFYEEKTEPLVDDEVVCTSNCTEGSKIILEDGSSWHVLSTNEDSITLFSDATIDLEGDYLPVNVFSTENTGVPIAFDIQNERLTENNPYCIFPDIGCSAYEKNGVDVFEDSTIKKVIDSKFLPKIIQTLKTENVSVRLLKSEEFEYLKSLESQNNTQYKWLYYSGYWLMTPYNKYSVMAHKENTYDLSIKAAYITHGCGIRPVIEVDKKYIF